MNFDLTGAAHYHYGSFPPEGLDYQLLLPAVVSASSALARFDQMVKTLHNESLFLVPLRNQEAILSSRIEGTISTLDEILEYDADTAPGNGEAPMRVHQVRPDIIETILYRRALTAAQKSLEEGYPLTSSMLKSMHQLLLSFGRGSKNSPGQFKTEQNYIGEKSSRKISFVPIAPEQLDQGLATLFSYIKSNDHPDLIRIAATHLEFEALHPFQDGNGRIGRMLVTLLLWRTGAIASPHFYISQFFEENKDEYIAKMRAVSETKDWNEWFLFFLEAVTVQADRNLKTMESIRDLYESLKLKFNEILSSKYAARLLDAIFERPVFKSGMIVESCGIPHATANRLTRALIDEEILLISQEASGRRAAIFAFEPLLELVRV